MFAITAAYLEVQNGWMLSQPLGRSRIAGSMVAGWLHEWSYAVPIMHIVSYPLFFPDENKNAKIFQLEGVGNIQMDTPTSEIISIG